MSSVPSLSPPSSPLRVPAKVPAARFRPHRPTDVASQAASAGFPLPDAAQPTTHAANQDVLQIMQASGARAAMARAHARARSHDDAQYAHPIFHKPFSATAVPPTTGSEFESGSTTAFASAFASAFAPHAPPRPATDMGHYAPVTIPARPPTTLPTPTSTPASTSTSPGILTHSSASAYTNPLPTPTTPCTPQYPSHRLSEHIVSLPSVSEAHVPSSSSAAPGAAVAPSAPAPYSIASLEQRPTPRGPRPSRDSLTSQFSIASGTSSRSVHSWGGPQPLRPQRACPVSTDQNVPTTSSSHESDQLAPSQSKSIGGPTLSWSSANLYSHASSAPYPLSTTSETPVQQPAAAVPPLTPAEPDSTTVQPTPIGATRGSLRESHSSLSNSEGRGSGTRTPVRPGSPLLAHEYNPERRDSLRTSHSGSGQRDSRRVDDLLRLHGLNPDEFVQRGFYRLGDAPSTLEVDELADELEALRAHNAGSLSGRSSHSGWSELEDELDDELGPSVSDNEQGSDPDDGHEQDDWSDEDGASTLVGSSVSFTSALPNARRSMRASRRSTHTSRRTSESRSRTERRNSLHHRPSRVHPRNSLQRRSDVRRSTSRHPRTTGTTLAPIQSITNLPATQSGAHNATASNPDQARPTGDAVPEQRVRLRDRFRPPASIGFFYGASTTNVAQASRVRGLTSRSNPSLLGFSLRSPEARPAAQGQSPPLALNPGVGQAGTSQAEAGQARRSHSLDSLDSLDSLLSDASTLNEHRRRMGAGQGAQIRRPGQAAPEPVNVPRGPRLPRFGRSTPNLLSSRLRGAAPPGPGGPGNHLFPSTSRISTTARPTTAPSGTEGTTGTTGRNRMGNPLFSTLSRPSAPGPTKPKRGKLRAGIRRLFAHTLSPSTAAH